MQCTGAETWKEPLDLRRQSRAQGPARESEGPILLPRPRGRDGGGGAWRVGEHQWYLHGSRTTCLPVAISPSDSSNRAMHRWRRPSGATKVKEVGADAFVIVVV